MKMNRKIFLVLAAAAIFCAPSVQAAQLVLNGGFELPADPVGPGYTTNAPTSWVALTGTEPVFRGNNPGTYGDNKVFLIAPRPYLGDDLAGKKIVKAKGAKNISVGIANIVATFNNTQVSITDMQG